MIILFPILFPTSDQPYEPGDMVYFKPGIGAHLQGHLVEVVEYKPPRQNDNGLYIVHFDDGDRPDQAFGAAWFTKEFVPRVPKPTNLREHLSYIGWTDYEQIADAYAEKGMEAALDCVQSNDDDDEFVDELRENIESWVNE